MPTEIFNLPDDINHHIYSFFNVKNRAALGAVSKKPFRRIIVNHPRYQDRYWKALGAASYDDFQNRISHLSHGGHDDLLDLLIHGRLDTSPIVSPLTATETITEWRALPQDEESMIRFLKEKKILPESERPTARVKKFFLYCKYAILAIYEKRITIEELHKLDYTPRYVFNNQRAFCALRDGLITLEQTQKIYREIRRVYQDSLRTSFSSTLEYCIDAVIEGRSTIDELEKNHPDKYIKNLLYDDNHFTRFEFEQLAEKYEESVDENQDNETVSLNEYLSVIQDALDANIVTFEEIMQSSETLHLQAILASRFGRTALRKGFITIQEAEKIQYANLRSLFSSQYGCIFLEFLQNNLITIEQVQRFPSAARLDVLFSPTGCAILKKRNRTLFTSKCLLFFGGSIALSSGIYSAINYDSLISVNNPAMYVFFVGTLIALLGVGLRFLYRKTLCDNNKLYEEIKSELITTQMR